MAYGRSVIMFDVVPDCRSRQAANDGAIAVNNSRNRGPGMVSVIHGSAVMPKYSCADDACVISFFGSSGIHCYDHSGKQL